MAVFFRMAYNFYKSVSILNFLAVYVGCRNFCKDDAVKKNGIISGN